MDGESLSEVELISACKLLLIGGDITTTNLIGNALLCFNEHPESLERLCEQPELMPHAMEEVLRYRPPLLGVRRLPLSYVELARQQIKRGETIIAWLACANHDPAQFPHPERFDIERNSKRHLSFGYGVHFCMGTPLIRLEAKIALTIMLERLLNIERDRSQDIEPGPSIFFSGAKHIPITFTHCEGTMQR